MTPHLYVDDPKDARYAAELLRSGAPIAQAFGNFYAITARGDAASVGRINVMKGRPVDQVGSVTLPRSRQSTIFDWSALPDGLSREQLEAVFDAFFELGPFGFRGPASERVGDHLASLDGGVRTTQLIAPGYACPSTEFLEHAAAAAGDDLLYVTSANRSRHLTGADDTPAHWQAKALCAEFASAGSLVLLGHPDETAARQRYPRHLPMSTTILAFHRTERLNGRVCLSLERHGSLHLDDVAVLLAQFDLGLVLGPRARSRLTLRTYPEVA
ncbi:hypothetical protein [Jatrophihabitans sp.]|uniref:hypothetical protein n=1 Tax=Jatrophihabitans sp. TaxID=1932789 RepID=UPI0030C73DF4|nr:hypothetical protein [Jatrophihabitans sp.]